MKPSTIGTIISLSSVVAWIFGILTLFGGNGAMGILLIIVAIVLTYGSSVWKRELRHQEVLDAIKDQEDG